MARRVVRITTRDAEHRLYNIRIVNKLAEFSKHSLPKPCPSVHVVYFFQK